MIQIGFIGLGHMGLPMATNLVKQGYSVSGYDLSSSAMNEFINRGGQSAASAYEAAKGCDYVISMLPESRHAIALYLEGDKLFNTLKKPTFIMDCSTIDPSVSLDLHRAAEAAGHRLLDAPVSGGVVGAEGATLTFMVGGHDRDFEVGKSVLAAMGKKIFHAGGPSHGQAAKTCNNMMLAIHMIATCEAFLLAENLGLDKRKLFEIASNSSGQSWSLTNYCPVPDLVPSSPANRSYQPGFTSTMMLKDLHQAQRASHGTTIPLGDAATALYQRYCDAGGAAMDFSGIINYLKNSTHV